MEQSRDTANEPTKEIDYEQKPIEDENKSEKSSMDNEEKKDKELINVTKTIQKASFKKNYAYISDKVRIELLDAVKIKKEKIKDVAKRLGINYSSAKSICQVFEKEGRANRIIIKKKGLMEDGSNGINNIAISEAMLHLPVSFKTSEVGLSSNTKKETNAAPQILLLTERPATRDPIILHLPQLACINVDTFLKQPGVSNSVPHSGMVFSNTQIRPDLQFVPYPLKKMIITPPNQVPQINSLQANNQTTSFYLNVGTNTGQEVYTCVSLQNLPLASMNAGPICSQQTNHKFTGNVIFPVVQIHNHTIGKGHFSLHM